MLLSALTVVPLTSAMGIVLTGPSSSPASTRCAICSGKDKGKTGVIKRRAGDKVVVSELNLVTKHRKSDPSRGVVGGITKQEAPIHESNVAILNKETGKADRVGIVIDDETGEKRRVYKSTRQFIDS